MKKKVNVFNKLNLHFLNNTFLFDCVFKKIKIQFKRVFSTDKFAKKRTSQIKPLAPPDTMNGW